MNLKPNFFIQKYLHKDGGVKEKMYNYKISRKKRKSWDYG